MLRPSSSHALTLFALIALVALNGCSGATPTPFPKTTPIAVPTVITVIAPYVPPTTDAPTATPTPAVFVPTALPAAVGLTLIPATPGGASRATPTAAASANRTATVPAGKMRVQVFLIALDDNGKAGKKIGCGDSVVAVERLITQTNAPLTATLNDLLAIRDQTYGQSGLYNALAQSSLKIEGINIVAAKATISLSGKLTLNGECDNPRVEAQIKETALQFSTVKDVAILLNNVPLDRALSGKGN